MSVLFNDANSRYLNHARADFELQPPITISFWGKISANTAGHSFYYTGKNSGTQLYPLGGNPGKIRMYVREKTPVQWQYCDSTNNIVHNQWYHFCLVVISNDIHFYLDSVDQEAVNPGGYGGDIQYYALDPVIELALGFGFAGTIDGTMEEFAFWDKELTAAQILLLAKSFRKRLPLQIEPGNLVCYFPLDDKNIGAAYGTVEARDMSVNVLHFDGQNSPTGAEGILSYPSKIISV